MDSFGGHVLHTAAWDENIDIEGKRVAIVGAGASAIQVLPAIQGKVEHVDIYIRTPSWITPPILESLATSKNFQYTLEEQERFKNDLDYSVKIRKEMESSSNRVLRAIIKGSREQVELREKLENNMKALIKDPELQELLIPKFEVGCRRLSPGEPYLQALQSPKVTPIFGDIEAITAVILDGR